MASKKKTIKTRVAEDSVENKKETITRIDAQLAKWPIWVPTNSRSSYDNATPREIVRPEGKRLTIHPLAHKLTTTTKTQRRKLTKNREEERRFVYKHLSIDDYMVLLALHLTWEEAGRPVGVCKFSFYRVAKILGKPWGGETLRSLKESLRRLRGCLLEWENSYVDPETEEITTDTDTFHFLDDLKLREQKSEKEKAEATGYFRFNRYMEKGLRKLKKSRPVLIDTLKSIKSEIGKLLYTHLDLMLSSRTRWERGTAELFADLGLEGETYRYLSKRKERLEPAIKELKGKSFATGRIKDIRLEPMKTREDLKLVVEKEGLHKELPEPEEEKLSEVKSKGFEQAESLLRHFYKVFHGEESPYISEKAHDQALALIAQLGYDKARYVIEYSSTAAKKTNYSPATFGGIMQYVAAAMTEYDKKDLAKKRETQARKKNVKAKEHTVAVTTQEEVELEKYLALLSPEETMRFEKEALDATSEGNRTIYYSAIKDKGTLFHITRSNILLSYYQSIKAK